VISVVLTQRLSPAVTGTFLKTHLRDESRTITLVVNVVGERVLSFGGEVGLFFEQPNARRQRQNAATGKRFFFIHLAEFDFAPKKRSRI
jgi:hypothetical protein